MIVSVSISGPLLKQADALIEEKGYKSRSELFRAALKAMADEPRESISGPTSCVLVMTYRKEKGSALNSVKHAYEELVSTQLHTHLAESRCTELFVMHGDAERIKGFMKDARRSGAEKLVLIRG
jgi:CopG family transcriptional regulator, nickel-responsive regulator